MMAGIDDMEERRRLDREAEAAYYNQCAECDLKEDEIARLQKALNRVRQERDCYVDAIHYVHRHYPEDIWIPGGTSIDAQSAAFARKTCDNIIHEAQKRIADMMDDAS